MHGGHIPSELDSKVATLVSENRHRHYAALLPNIVTMYALEFLISNR